MPEAKETLLGPSTEPTAQEKALLAQMVATMPVAVFQALRTAFRAKGLVLNVAKTEGKAVRRVRLDA